MANGSDIRLRRVVLAFASGIATQWYCPYGQFLRLTPPLMTSQSYIKPFQRWNCPRVANPWLTEKATGCFPSCGFKKGSGVTEQYLQGVFE